MSETGSSSLQIAFPVDDATDPAKHIYPVDIEGKKISVYEYSYLCYGESEALRRFHALLIKVMQKHHILYIHCKVVKGFLNLSHSTGADLYLLKSFPIQTDELS